MQDLIQKYVGADAVIWSFPLYYFGMPSKLKAFLDRTLPINLPFIELSESGTADIPPAMICPVSDMSSFPPVDSLR